MKKAKWQWFLCTALLLMGAWIGVSKTVTVSNTVNGRELPIYSVNTPDKKVALSFDAAWE